jgi:ABC-type transporter Mla subunit MlaD
MVVVLLAGAFFAGQAVDAVGAGLDSVLAITVDTLDTVSATLEQTKATIVEANKALDTAAEATVNLARTLSDTQPLMGSLTKVVAEDVPGNIEAIEMAIPNVAEVAAVIDTALTKLSNFGVKQTIPIPFNPITLEFDLGIDYDPAEPFDDTISALGDSLEGMPDELRSLQSELDTLSADLALVTGNIETAAGDVEAINKQVALFIPILEDYLRIVGQISNSMVQARGQVLAQLEMVKTALTALFIFLSLTQLTPLYVGWELVTGKRPGQESQKEVVEEPPQPQPESLVEEVPKVVAETVVEESPEDYQETAVDELPQSREEEVSEG